MSVIGEKGLIGCILLEPVTCWHQSSAAGITETWLSDRSCRKAWNIIGMMDRERVNVLTVNEESLKRNDEVSIDFLNDCIDHAPVAPCIGRWIAELRLCHLRRTIKQAATSLSFEADDPDVDPEALLAKTQSTLHDALSSAESSKSTSDIYSEIIDNWKQAKNKNGAGLPTSCQELSKTLGGYRPGKVYVVASRPGGGKSTFMACEAFNMASKGHTVSIASIEMSEHELRGRILAGSADKSSFGLDTGYYDFIDIEPISEIAQDHAKLPLRIDDRYMTIDQLCAWAQFERIKHNTEFVAIDYLQLIPSGKRFESRNVEVTNNMNRLCELAKSLNVPILLLSQLSRNSSHEDRSPDLHDLRDSGAIEQGAYAVIFINHIKEKQGEYENEQSEFIVAKNRGGPTGHIKVKFERNRQRFS